MFKVVNSCNWIGRNVSSKYVSMVWTRSHSKTSTISHLQAAFRDPSSPFYLEPGTQGPSHPGEGFVNPDEKFSSQSILTSIRGAHSSATSFTVASAVCESENEEAAEEARVKLNEMGFDPESFFEQKVVWGDLDSFRHVNNVKYLRFLESGRIHWMRSLASDLGGPELAQNMVAGKGVSLILKDVSIKFRRPVLYPDTLLVAHRPHDSHPTYFHCAAAIWSYAQRAIVTTSDSTLVWYDYDILKKCDPGEDARRILERRIRTDKL